MKFKGGECLVVITSFVLFSSVKLGYRASKQTTLGVRPQHTVDEGQRLGAIWQFHSPVKITEVLT